MCDPRKGYPSVVPYVLYADPGAAIRWLCEVLGLREVLRLTRPDGTVAHAELELGGHIVMLGLKGGRFGRYPASRSSSSRTSTRRANGP